MKIVETLCRKNQHTYTQADQAHGKHCYYWNCLLSNRLLSKWKCYYCVLPFCLLTSQSIYPPIDYIARWVLSAWRCECFALYCCCGMWSIVRRLWDQLQNASPSERVAESIGKEKEKDRIHSEEVGVSCRMDSEWPSGLLMANCSICYYCTSLDSDRASSCSQGWRIN